MENIKLVIWDLDETFWSGTLSEGEITPIVSNIELVKTLTDRGIINSISSKNDFETAKQRLLDLGIWDYFVFPAIAWTPKGECVAEIIKNCQLRAANVLFVDDNVQNLKEVEFYNKDITAILPERLLEEIGDVCAIGKDDKKHSRLKQYKILEEKAVFQKKFSDNISFLQQSEIKLYLIKDLGDYVDRIHELVNRTNQLNFTKIRSTKEEIESLLMNTQYECACIHVSDRFGDYGICGFYALDKANHSLLHFLFSCRILNLNIENYIYNKLEKPKLNIEGSVSADLSKEIDVTWVKEVGYNCNDSKDSSISKKKILFVGGCDLEQMCHYIPADKYECIKDFNFPNERGIAVHKEHTVYLREVETLTNTQKEEIANLPFGDPRMFSNKLFEDDYDFVVFSVLMNYTHEVYTNKKYGFKVSYGGYLGMEELLKYLKMSDEESESFKRNYLFEGLQSTENFRHDLEWLAKRIKKPIIFINGAEVESVSVNEPDAYRRHCDMNKVLDDFVESHSNCYLVDVRKFATNRSDMKDTIRHYQRTVYLKMAEEVLVLLNDGVVGLTTLERCRYKIQAQKNQLLDKVRLVVRNIKHIIKNEATR